MKTIFTSVLLLTLGLIFIGCSASSQIIHIDLPSRSEWKTKSSSREERTFEQTKTILLTWSNPTNDTPPKYVQIASSWGVTNIELKPNQMELLIKRSMFKKDPKVTQNAFIFWLSPTFANEVNISENSASAKEVYYVGSFQMQNN
jgi:hypothetical protein